VHLGLRITLFVREECGKEKCRTIRFGLRSVHMPGRDTTLSLLVVKGFGAG
jgi:hypothetical protein